MRNNQRKGIMLVLSSPSGAGKTSICKKVLETEKKFSYVSFLHNSTKRKSEEDGKDYIFVKKKFDDLQSKKIFC